MNRKTLRYGLALTSAVTFAALAGCGSDGTEPTPPPPATSTRFSFFTENVFGAKADSTPVPVNGVVFDYDVNNDPTAFDYAFVM